MIIVFLIAEFYTSPVLPIIFFYVSVHPSLSGGKFFSRITSRGILLIARFTTWIDKKNKFWKKLQEDDSEDIKEEVFRADVIESNGESEHSYHNTNTEKSSPEDDEEMILSLIWIILILSVGWILVRWSQVKKYWSDRGVPHLPPHPILGSLTFLQRENAALWMLRLYEQFKSPYIGIWLMWKPAIFINCPTLARKILIQDSSNFRNRHVSSGVTDPVGGLNLFTVNDPIWTNIRRKLTNIFTAARLKNQHYHTQTKSKELVKRIQNEGDNMVDLKELFEDCTTDVFGTFAFGIESNATLTGQGPLRYITRDFVKFSVYRGLSMFSIFFWPEIVDIFRFTFFPKSSSDLFCKIFNSIMDDRIKKNSKRQDLIDTFLKIQEESDKKNENLPQDLLVAQAAILLQGGFDTSGTTLTYAFYEIAHNPEIQDKIYQELKEAKQRCETEDFDVEALENLTYIDCVIQETLRKYSPMGWMDRIALADYEIDEKLTVKAGTPVYINAIGMHYDPDYFPDPYNFNPDRFLPENKIDIKSYTYLPFGEGPRHCIGKRFAMMTMRYIMAELLFNYRVQPLPNKPTPNEVKVDKITLFYAPGELLYLDFVPR